MNDAGKPALFQFLLRWRIRACPLRCARSGASTYVRLRADCIRARLRRLATKLGEKRGLARNQEEHSLQSPTQSDHNSRCNVDKLVQYLNSQLDLDAELELFDHLDRCNACRDTIYRICRDRERGFLLLVRNRKHKVVAN